MRTGMGQDERQRSRLKQDLNLTRTGPGQDHDLNKNGPKQVQD